MKNNTIKIFLLVLTTFLVVFVSSCTQETDFKNHRKVSLTLHSVEMGYPLEKLSSFEDVHYKKNGVDTRAVENHNIDNFWLMLFDGNGKLIKASYYEEYTSSGQQLYLKMPEGSEQYTLRVLANIAENELDVRNSCKTIADANNAIKTFSSSQDIENSASSIMKVGEVKYGASDTQLTCNLYNCLAKITLSVKNVSGSNMIIQNIEVHNIPNKLAYFSALPDSNHDNVSEFTALSYKKDQGLNIAEGNGTEKVFYITPNYQGTPADLSSNTDPKEKSGEFAPKNATFVQITAMPKDSDGSNIYNYTFYLGDDMVKNFDVKSNNNYILTLNIKGSGDAESDSRVEQDIYVIDLSSKDANSYIINSTADVQPYYQWKIDRGDTYWKGKSPYDFYISVAEDKPENFMIKKDPKDTEGTNIRPIVIWEDYNTSGESGSGTPSSDKITFYDKNGNRLGVEKDGTPKEDWFTTMDNCFFKVEKGTKGNALIGIVTEAAYKKGEKASEQLYAWSWHLWLTDYQPEEAFKQEINSTNYVYTVPADGKSDGGHVYRYKNDAQSDSWWNKPENAKAVIMDRNLGAMGVDYENSSYSMYYQAGRKDPFSTKVKSPQTLTSTSGANNTLAISVTQPYNIAKSTGNWVNNNLLKDYGNWQNPTWNKDKSKSYFDPCPYGWKVPDKDVFDLHKDDFENENKRVLYTIDSSTSPKIQTVFPLTGYIIGETGVLEDVNVEGWWSNVSYLWTENPVENSNWMNNYAFRVSDQVKSDNDDFLSFGIKKKYQSYACPVRCVRDTK